MPGREPPPDNSEDEAEAEVRAELHAAHRCQQCGMTRSVLRSRG